MKTTNHVLDRTQIPLTLEKELKRILRQRDMNASELARATGISRKTLQNWLTGAYPSNVEQLKQAADVLSVTLEELCFGCVPVVKSGSADSVPLGLGAESEFMKYEVTVRRL